MHSEQERLGTRDSSRMQPLQVSHFLLGPSLDHFPGIALVVPVAEPELARDVPVPVFECEDGRLVNLDGPMRMVFRYRMVHVGLFSGGYAPIDLIDHISVEHFE